MSYSVDPDFDLESWRNNVEGKRTETAVSISDVVAAVRDVYKAGEDVTTAAVSGPLIEATGATIRTIQRKLKEAAASGYLKIGSKRGSWRLGSKPLKQ
jgi:hypothetical protein